MGQRTFCSFPPFAAARVKEGLPSLTIILIFYQKVFYLQMDQSGLNLIFEAEKFLWLLLEYHLQ